MTLTPQLLPAELLSADDLCSFIEDIYPASYFPAATDPNPPARKRPFVTLTYAQSLDGKIAGPGGKQIRLSGDESMRLTHR